MSKWLIWLGAAVAAIVAGVVLFNRPQSSEETAPTGDSEARIIAYLKDNVTPGRQVLVTELYNKVFTSPEDQAALDRLYKTFFRIPATAADIYTKTGKIPTLEELSGQFQFKIPGEMDVLLRVLESDPRIPRFFERDPASGEITSIHVDLIAADERFGRGQGR